MSNFKTVQDLFMEDFIQESGNETVDVLEFMRNCGSSLSKEQLKCMLLLKEQGLEDISNYVLGSKVMVTPQKTYMDTLNKLTLADRIKGNAKLSKLLGSNANPVVATNEQVKGGSMR